MAAKRTTKAVTASNEPQQYEVLKKFRFLKKWHEIGDVLTLTPSQAHFFIRANKLKVKGAK